jgi:TolA-binding protein
VSILELILGALALIIGGTALWQTRALRTRVDTALGSSSGTPLETLLAEHHDRVTEVNQRMAHLTDEYERLAGMASLASQKISLVRFNPFGDTGGDQSFSLAVLDSQNSGYVLTSIHGRQGTRVYVKPIDFGKSKYSLSTEEQQAIAQATKRVPHTTNTGGTNGTKNS